MRNFYPRFLWFVGNVALSAAQLLFVDGLLVFKTQVAAAEHAGISFGTACRWWKLPEVRAEFDRVRQVALSLTIAHLQMAGPDAVETLVKQLTSPDPRTAGKAAGDILRNMWKGTETGDVLAEVQRLRGQVEQLKNAGLGGDASAEADDRGPDVPDSSSPRPPDSLPQ